MTYEELCASEWAQNMKARAPRTWERIHRYIQEPGFCVRIGYDAAEEAWFIAPNMPGFHVHTIWLDWADSRSEAISACIERGWRIFE